MILMAYMANSCVTSTVYEHIKENLMKDPMAQTIMNLSKEGKTHQFWVEDGLLWVKGRRFFIPKVSDLRKMENAFKRMP